MNDLKFAFRQLLKNPGFTAVAVRCYARAPSLARLLCPIARRDFETRDQQDVHDLVIVGFVMAVNEHFTPAGGQGDVILVFHQQSAPVSRMNDKGAKRSIVKQLPDFIGFHVSNDSRRLASGKPRKVIGSVGA